MMGVSQAEFWLPIGGAGFQCQMTKLTLNNGISFFSLY